MSACDNCNIDIIKLCFASGCQSDVNSIRKFELTIQVQRKIKIVKKE